MYYTQPPTPPPTSYVSIVASSEAVRTPLSYLAQTNDNSTCSDGQYGSDVYGSDIYGGDTANDCNTSSAELINTGTLVALIVTVATLLIFAALLARFWKRPTKKSDEDHDNK